MQVEHSPRDDAALAAASQQGDRSAFTELVGKYERLVFKIALSKCGNRSDAEDLSQEIFLHAYRSLPRLRDPQAFLGWLIAIAHNRSHRFFRSRRAKVIALEDARREMEQELHRRQVGRAEEERMVELVRSLPDEYRLALSWKYLEGCSYEEIGERLSLSFHQVDYLLRRAKSALRRASEKDTRKREGSRDGESDT